MKRTTLVFLLEAVMISFLIMSGCSGDRSTPPAGTNEPDLVTVTGEVTFIYDNVAADGGVTIDLKLDNDSSERLLFAPLYWGDDSEDRWALYSKIQDVEVGDRIRAVGHRTERGIELQKLDILVP